MFAVSQILALFTAQSLGKEKDVTKPPFILELVHWSTKFTKLPLYNSKLLTQLSGYMELKSEEKTNGLFEGLTTILIYDTTKTENNQQYGSDDFKDFIPNPLIHCLFK